MNRATHFQSRASTTAGIRLFAASALVAIGLVVAVERAGAAGVTSAAPAESYGSVCACLPASGTNSR